MHEDDAKVSQSGVHLSQPEKSLDRHDSAMPPPLPHRRLSPFHFEVFSWDKRRAKFVYFENVKGAFKELTIGPNANAACLLEILDRIIKAVVSMTVAELPGESEHCYFLCKSVQVIARDLHGFAVVLGADVSAFEMLFDYFYYDGSNLTNDTLNKLNSGITSDQISRMKLQKNYQTEIDWASLNHLSHDASCTLAVKLPTCKDQDLQEVGKLFRGLNIVSGGICPLINKCGSGSRSQDILIAFESDEMAAMAFHRGQQLCAESNPPLVSCSIIKNAPIRNIYQDVHPECRRLLNLLSPQCNSLVRIKGLNFQTTSSQLVGVIGQELGDREMFHTDSGGVAMPLRGPQQSLKTGDAFVLCRDLSQALLLKQRFAHYNMDQRSWEVYLSSPAEMIQIFRAHVNNEFTTRNKRANPFVYGERHAHQFTDKMFTSDLLLSTNAASLIDFPLSSNLSSTSVGQAHQQQQQHQSALTHAKSTTLGAAAGMSLSEQPALAYHAPRLFTEMPTMPTLMSCLPAYSLGNGLFMNSASPGMGLFPSNLYSGMLPTLGLLPGTASAFNVSQVQPLLTNPAASQLQWLQLPFLPNTGMLPALTANQCTPLLWNEASRESLVDLNALHQAGLFHPFSNIEKH